MTASPGLDGVDRPTRASSSLPRRWCDAANTYHEKALLCRALENTVYVASANVAAPDQGSISGIVAPDGRLIASLPYGGVGVVAADVELDEATRELAMRWAPERNREPAAAALMPRGNLPDKEKRPKELPVRSRRR